MNSKLRFKLLSIILLAFLAFIALAPMLAPFDPFAVNIKQALQPMGSTHLFGTDQLGRDLFSRILYGGQTSLGLAILVVIGTTVLGACVGLVAGYAGGKLDSIISKFIDIWLSLPEVVMAIALIGILGPNVYNVLLSLVLVKWAEYARITRSLVLCHKESEYVRFAYMSGASVRKVLKTYIFPNVASPLLVVACQHVGEVILTIAGFSLIGIGVQPPTPEWGSILMQSKDYMQTAPWLLFCPGAAIFLSVVLFNWWGDELRDKLDPRTR